MKNAAAVAYVRELCLLGLACELLVPALLQALHRVIPSACNLFDWVDADGSIRRYCFEGPIDHAVAKLYFEEFHNRREAEAMPLYRDVIAGPVTIRSAQELDNRRFFESALYHEIWRPQNLHYRLEAIVRGRDAVPLGSLVLYRARGDRIFDRSDERMLRTLVPYIARGLQMGREQPVGFVASGRQSALVNLDATGRIVHLSRSAHKLLLLAHGDVSPATAAVAPQGERFPTLAMMHRNLLRQGCAQEAACALTLTNSWGRFVFRGDRLDPVGPEQGAVFGITIEHLVPREVHALDRIEAMPLSIAQKKVCALALRGMSRPQIALHLGVRESTVVDHLRKVYTKLDIHSVDELRARLDA
jgi:DNA-binding CsgD family transcriptional regulator